MRGKNKEIAHRLIKSGRTLGVSDKWIHEAVNEILNNRDELDELLAPLVALYEQDSFGLPKEFDPDTVMQDLYKSLDAFKSSHAPAIQNIFLNDALLLQLYLENHGIIPDR